MAEAAESAKAAALEHLEEGYDADAESDLEDFAELQEDMEDMADLCRIGIATIESQRFPRGIKPPSPSKRRHDNAFDAMRKFLGPSFTDLDFERKFRMGKFDFHALVELIKDHDIFQSSPGAIRPQNPVEMQLLTTLYWLGHEGNAASMLELGRDFNLSGEQTTTHCSRDDASQLTKPSASLSPSF